MRLPYCAATICLASFTYDGVMILSVPMNVVCERRKCQWPRIRLISNVKGVLVNCIVCPYPSPTLDGSLVSHRSNSSEPSLSTTLFHWLRIHSRSYSKPPSHFHIGDVYRYFLPSPASSIHSSAQYIVANDPDTLTQIQAAHALHSPDGTFKAALLHTHILYTIHIRSTCIKSREKK